MLTCRQITELVTDYLEGRLTFVQRMSFHMHVGMCVHCRAYLRQMKLTIRATGKLPPSPIPADVRDELLRRFRNWKATDGTGDPDGSPGQTR